ncbi:reverse transcriptase domain-containing protein [Tanacetum coccineum]
MPTQPDFRFVVPTFLPTDDPITSLNKDMLFFSSAYSSRYPPINNQFRTSFNPRTQAIIQNDQVTVQNVQGRQSQGYADNATKNQVTGARVVNIVGDAGANQPRVIRCYNCKGEGHIAKQCTAKKRVKDSEWFKDKMLLTQAQEAGVVLNKEQQDFLADRLKENNDCDDLQLHTTTNFKADHVNAYVLNCDDQATVSAIFMASLSSAGSLNDDTVTPTYDSNKLFEVSHYDTYHDDAVLNSVVQEMKYNEHSVSHDDSYPELTSDNNNVISYVEYMVTIQDEADHYVPPPVENKDMMLFVIDQMKSQVDHCKTVNQEAKSVNDSFSTELEKYKHNPASVCDSEKTLILAEKSRLKMTEKQTEINAKLIDYSKLNNLYEYFVPQKQLSTEQLYWSSKPTPSESVSKPTNVFPKKLSSTSQVLKNLQNARDLLRRVSYTDASGSKIKSNTRNDRIPQPSSRSKKNKVEAQPRKSKSSSNKNNHVSNSNANVKSIALSKNSTNVCLSCNECLFSVNHDACVVKYLKDVKKCKKAKSVKQKEKIEWKSTRRVFKTVGLNGFPLVGNLTWCIMPSSRDVDHHDTAHYIPMYHRTRGFTGHEREIYKSLVNRLFHEGRVVLPDFLESEPNLRTTFAAIGFDKENGDMLLNSIKNGAYKLEEDITVKDTDGVTNIIRKQTPDDLSPKERLRYDSDIKAVNIILLGLPVDIYTLINHYQTAKEIWDRVKELMKGTEMTKQERASMLYDEFDKFTSEPGESIHSYYLRYAKLINDMNMIPMSMSNMQINMKFVNHLQPEWSRFVTVAKQARDLHVVNFDQLYAFLKHNEKDAKEVLEMR